MIKIKRINNPLVIMTILFILPTDGVSDLQAPVV